MMKQKLLLGFVALGFITPYSHGEVKRVDMTAANIFAVKHETNEFRRRVAKWSLATAAAACAGGAAWYVWCGQTPGVPTFPLPSAGDHATMIEDHALALNFVNKRVEQLAKKVAASGNDAKKSWLSRVGSGIITIGTKAVVDGPKAVIGGALVSCAAALGNTASYALRLPKMVAHVGGLFAPDTVTAYADTNTDLTEANSRRRSEFAQLSANAQMYDVLIFAAQTAQVDSGSSDNAQLHAGVAPYKLAIEETCNRIAAQLERVVGYMMYKAHKTTDTVVAGSLRTKAESLVDFANKLLEQVDTQLSNMQPGISNLAQAFAQEVVRRLDEFDRVA